MKAADLGPATTIIGDDMEVVGGMDSAPSDTQLLYDNPNAEHVDANTMIRNMVLGMNQSMMMNFSKFPKSPTSSIKVFSVILCTILGAVCVFLNLFVISALIRNRRHVLRNVFYVLVLHCAFVDLIRGTCLIAWGMPHLVINNMHTMRDRLLALKINQFTLVILRSCNLLTIFNLLVFTTNEFIVIKYPLHYRRCFRRRTVLGILAVSWLISLFFGLGSVFSNFFESAHTVMVLSDKNLLMRNDTATSSVTRREIGRVSINIVSMLMIFVLCYVCLFTVLICYGTILRTIRRFHSFDVKGNFHSDQSQRITYRSVAFLRHDDSTKTNASGATVCVDDDSANKRCNSHRKWKSHLMSRHKYLIVIGTVLFVDVLFLFPYSGIQLVAFLHLNNLLTTGPKSTIIRWGLQILIGVHSVCQPLCYFRMNEFRRLACCSNKELNRSKSFSQLHKSIGNTKDQLPTNDAVDELIALKDAQSRDCAEPLMGSRDFVNVIDDFIVPSAPVISQVDAQFLGANWTRIGSRKFRRYGPSQETEQELRAKLSILSGLRSSSVYDHESHIPVDHVSVA